MVVVVVLLSILCAVEVVIIAYLLNIVRIQANEMLAEDPPLTPAMPSLGARIKVFGDNIERWDEDAYGASEFQD